VGLLRNSHSSLQALVLSGTPTVTPADLHPALPHLRRLRSLDLSRCAQLGDITLHLLATCTTRDTLQVLYLKGPLPLVTGVGLQDVVQACRHLQVLDISYLTQLGNDSMAAIGRYLPQLRSLFLRDNYQITNDSVAAVDHRMNQSLEQLTLWGCTGLRQLRLGSADTLAVVNLWGCHSLRDDAADAFRGFAALRSLNMAECHRLTDEFVVRGGAHGGWCVPGAHDIYTVAMSFYQLTRERAVPLTQVTLTRHVPQLHHLSLRYCKRITDRSVEALAEYLPDLQTLDLSFCTRITVASLSTLLQVRGHVLTELRLWQCRPRGQGSRLIRVLQSLHHDCALVVLDLRHCALLLEDATLRRDLLEQLHFVESSQLLPGFFTREPRGGGGQRAMEQRYISYFERLYGVQRRLAS
jgi:Leucine Rich repeat